MAISYNSNYDVTIPFSDACYQIGVPAGAPINVTVPGSPTTNYQALFSYTSTANVFVCLNDVAAPPLIGNIESQQYNEFRPDKRYVRGGDNIYFSSPDADEFVGVSFRQLQGS